MRITCWYCHKNCTGELPNGTVFRAIAICPECIEKSPEAQLGKEDVSGGAKNTEQQVQVDSSNKE